MIKLLHTKSLLIQAHLEVTLLNQTRGCHMAASCLFREVVNGCFSQAKSTDYNHRCYGSKAHKFVKCLKLSLSQKRFSGAVADKATGKGVYAFDGMQRKAI